MKLSFRFLRLFLVAIIILCTGSNALLASESDSLIQLAEKQRTPEAQLAQMEQICLDHIWTNPLMADTLIDRLGSMADHFSNRFYKARYLFFKGMLKYKWQDLESAFEYYSDSRKILESMDSLKALAEVYHNMGLVHIRFGQRDEATGFLTKAQNINEKHGYVEQLIKNKIVLASLEPTLEDQIVAFAKIGRLSKEKNYLEGQFISRINIATLLNNLGKPDSALVVLKEAEDLMDETGYDKYTHNVFQLKGLIYNQQKRFDLAEEYLKKALLINEQKDQKGRMLELYLNLSGMYVKQHKYKEAYEYLDKHRKLRYTFDLQKKAESVAKIEADYQVELEKKENALLRRKAETARKQRILLALLLTLTLLTIALLTARYITRQKHVKELEKVNAQLNELNLEMESVLQVVSHDFRTPLAKIRMLNELIMNQEADRLSENARNKLNRIDGSIKEAEGLVSDILEIKRFYQDEELESEPEAFDISTEIESIIQQYQTPITLKKLVVHYQHKGEPTVIQEKDILKRIIGNLVSNAVKFTYENKAIWIDSERVDNVLTIRIKDEGPGFSEEDKSRLFKKFEHYSNKPITWGTSHGLGLYIVKKLVDRIKGSIELTSSREKGAEFIITLAAEIE